MRIVFPSTRPAGCVDSLIIPHRVNRIGCLALDVTQTLSRTLQSPLPARTAAEAASLENFHQARFWNRERDRGGSALSEVAQGVDEDPGDRGQAGVRRGSRPKKHGQDTLIWVFYKFFSQFTRCVCGRSLMTNSISRSAITLAFVMYCSFAQAQSPPDDLVELVQRRAVLSLTYGDRHPEVVELDTELSERIGAGEHFNLQLSAQRVEQLMEERQSMSRKLGRNHRRMLINALQIRALAGILQDFESMPILPPAAGEPGVRTVSKNDYELVEDLQYDMAAVALLQQLEGDWEIEQVAARGRKVERLVRERFRIEETLLQLDYPVEKISQVPPPYREAFQKPWKAVGFSPQLEAIEFQNIIVASTTAWRPVLCRRYVTYRDGRLLMVCSDDPRLSPQTLDLAKDNYVFSCLRTTPGDR